MTNTTEATTEGCYAAISTEGYWTCDVPGGCRDCRSLARSAEDDYQLDEWKAERAEIRLARPFNGAGRFVRRSGRFVLLSQTLPDRTLRYAVVEETGNDADSITWTDEPVVEGFAYGRLVSDHATGAEFKSVAR